MERTLTPEILDSLPPADAAAQASRRDLILLNRIMGHAGFISREIPSKVTSIAEIGAGDGTLAYKVVSNLPPTHLTLVDLHPSINRDQFTQKGWTIDIKQEDVFKWVETMPRFDCVFANLFLHHFTSGQLKYLFARLNCSLFIACEPRRSSLAAIAARSIWLLGCNKVTRHDAVVSVQAGFIGDELTQLWRASGWELKEKPAGLFSHLLIARKCAK